MLCVDVDAVQPLTVSTTTVVTLDVTVSWQTAFEVVTDVAGVMTIVVIEEKAEC
jgi:hypothetical protein